MGVSEPWIPPASHLCLCLVCNCACLSLSLYVCVCVCVCRCVKLCMWSCVYKGEIWVHFQPTALESEQSESPFFSSSHIKKSGRRQTGRGLFEAALTLCSRHVIETLITSSWGLKDHSRHPLTSNSESEILEISVRDGEKDPHASHEFPQGRPAISSTDQKHVLWGHSDLDLQPPNSKSVHLWVQVKVCTKVERIPWMGSWHIMFTR